MRTDRFPKAAVRGELPPLRRALISFVALPVLSTTSTAQIEDPPDLAALQVRVEAILEEEKTPGISRGR